MKITDDLRAILLTMGRSTALRVIEILKLIPEETP